MVNQLSRALPHHSDSLRDWEKLGNPGWNWDDFAKYTARASTYVPLPVYGSIHWLNETVI